MRFSTIILSLVALVLLVMVVSCAEKAPTAEGPAQTAPASLNPHGGTGGQGVPNAAAPVDGIDSVLLPWDDDGEELNREVAAVGPERPGAVGKPRTARRIKLEAGEELWVIAKPAGEAPAQPADDQPGTGSLMAKRGEEMVPVPLKHTDVKASIAGYVSSTTVTQQFHNPFDQKIEAVYVFPLPENAAINEFVMTIGDRKIRGIIREREEAEKIYAEARAQGHVASLMTQERPNIFTQKVANIEPGKAIDVEVTYYHTMAYVDGWYEWVFPMVVGPRYNPAGSTQGVGAAPRGKPGGTGQATEVQYLKPNERSGHDIALRVEVSAPVSLEEIECKTHQVQINRPGEKRAIVEIAKSDTLPNKDFVLRYRVAGDRIKTGLIAHRDQRGGFFSLVVYPPLELKEHKRGPVEMVFLLDVSGSMSGKPIEQSKSAMRYALANMDQRDSFQVIVFSGSNRVLFERPVPVTQDNVKQAMRFVEDQAGGGGTEMLPAIDRALSNAPEDRQRFIVFLTDGFVGNEADILEMTAKKIGTGRVFAFGVGSSPNRYLMDGLGRVGRGAVAYLGLKDDGAQVMKAFLDRIASPAMTNIRVDFGSGMKTKDVYPTKVGDLFVGRPITMTGRFDGELSNTVQVHGMVEGRDTNIPVEVDRDSVTNPALASIWARHRITDLSEQMFQAPAQASEFAADVKRTALEYGLLSQFTAFIAVDSSRVTEGDHGVSVAVPVPVPEGVKYETTVPEN